MTQHSATIQSDAMSEPQSSYCSVQAKHDMVGMLRSSSRAQNHSGYAPNVTPEEQGHNYGGHRKVKALAEDDWLNERSNHGVADALRYDAWHDVLIHTCAYICGIKAHGR